MKKVLWILLVSLFAINSFAQQVKSHKVEKGENVYRIAKRYNTTAEEIYKINPGAKDGITEGQILAIPIIDNAEYNTHTVSEGDTVYSLSKKYNTTPEAIYELNPEARNGINLGQILRVSLVEKKTDEEAGKDKIEEISDPILDSIKPLPEIKKIISFKTHKVKRKETLYGIAQKYDVTVDDIKKQNKRLYSEEIKKKDKIRIPVFEKSTETENVWMGDSRLSTTVKYTIKPKDTRFSISRRHGITIEELDLLNPGLDPNLPIGTVVTVPASVFIPYDQDVVAPGFELYTVPPKETMFNLVRTLNISSDSLLRMNPYIKDGLKAGMVITIPERKEIDSLGIDYAEGKILDLKSKLYNYKPKKLAVMLPFGLEGIDLDQRNEVENYLKSRKAQGTRVALDFYKGVLMAIDFAKEAGITTDVSVYDTQKNKNEAYLKKIINEGEFDELDVVVGPLYQANVEVVASELNKYDTPVISPISNKESKLYDNFFQTIPSNAMLQDKLVSFIKKDSIDKNIILIVQTGTRYDGVRKKMQENFPEAKIAKIEKGNYLYEVNLNKVLVKNKLNWVILESNDVAMISNVAALLNAKAESHQITLFTSNKNKAYDNDSVKNEHLSKLHLHYPSINKIYDSTVKEESPFVTSFEKKYGMIPNEFSVRGFDITYDLLLRLGTADDLYHAASVEGTTEYLENKFNYAKKPLGGYYNKALYLIRFEDNLKLTVVE